MEDVTTLVLQVRSDQVKKAGRELDNLTTRAKAAETATGGLMSKWKAFMGFLAGAASLTTAIAGLRKLIEVSKQFESLEAQLRTATGSAENAKEAFAALTDFATQTPYDLGQAVEAFIKLVNLGLNPGERALRSYGDTASAMGQELSQMVQAVARATAGEYEPLKAFGISARKEADGITFTFRGLSEKVKNDTKSIEEYFIRLGEANFSGAMLERMGTLEGKLSNLGDAWDQMFYDISKAGVGELIKSSVDLAISAIEELRAQIMSGQLEENIIGIGTAFSGWKESIQDAYDYYSRTIRDMREDGGSVGSAILEGLANLPENVLALLKLVGVQFGTLTLYGEAAFRALWDSGIGYFNLLIDSAENAGELIGKNLFSPLSARDNIGEFLKKQTLALNEFAGTSQRTWSHYVADMSGATVAGAATVETILEQNAATIAAKKAHFDAAGAKRKEWEEQQRLNAAVREMIEEVYGKPDRLEGFGKGGDQQTEEFNKLRLSLRSQEEALVQSHVARRQLILDNTKSDKALQEELLAQQDLAYQRERSQLLEHVGMDLEVRETAFEDRHNQEMWSLSNGYLEKTAMLDELRAQELAAAGEDAEKRLAIEEEYKRRSLQLEQRFNTSKKDMEDAYLNSQKAKQLNAYATVLSVGQTLATQMQEIAERSGKDAKAAFYASKAIAIAQAIIATELAAMQVAADWTNTTWIGKTAAVAATRVMGYASVALMAATTVAGYEDGGIIPGNSFSGDRVPARVNSGEMILNYGQQKQLFDMANGKGSAGGGNVTLIVNNQGTATEATVTSERDTEDGKMIELLLRQIDTRTANGIKGGGTQTARAFETTYNLRRGGGVAA